MGPKQKKSRADEQHFEGIMKYDNEGKFFQDYIDVMDRAIKAKFGKIGYRAALDGWEKRWRR
jgi:hypothetical protein